MAGGADGLRPYSAAAKRGGNRPGPDGPPAEGVSTTQGVYRQRKGCIDDARRVSTAQGVNRQAQALIDRPRAMEV